MAIWWSTSRGMRRRLRRGRSRRRSRRQRSRSGGARRPRKGEEQAKEPSRLERQLTMSLPQMLADLPRACDVGTKRNAKGVGIACTCTRRSPSMRETLFGGPMTGPVPAACAFFPTGLTPHAHARPAARPAERISDENIYCVEIYQYFPESSARGPTFSKSVIKANADFFKCLTIPECPRRRLAIYGRKRRVDAACHPRRHGHRFGRRDPLL